MPPVTAENDLKRRARRRLIGAVALALAAVIVVPLLLEDEPPPPGHLDVRMKPVSGSGSNDSEGGNGQPADQPIVAVVPPALVAQPLAEPSGEVPNPADTEPPARTAQPASEPAALPAPPKPAPPPPPPKPAPSPAKPPQPKAPAAAPEAAKPAPVRPEPASVASRPQKGAFVIQLAALRDASRARQLQQRAAKSGLPVYTDRAGELTRVRVGPFASRDLAVAAAVRLAEIGLTGQILSQ